MQIEENKSLKAFNTFGIDAKAKYFGEFTSVDELREGIKWAKHENIPYLILGGGSNVLLTEDFNGIVLKNAIKGIEKTEETDEHVHVKAGAGEVWHDLVMHAVENNLGGIENLSLIPGTVGAAPIQNIGAYGVELQDVFHELEALNIESGEVHKFDKHGCDFGYRYSIFKGPEKGKYIITSVELKLEKEHNIKDTYGSIKDMLEMEGIEAPTIQDISHAVIAIRQSKLPDPAELGNAGSFFKNPVISEEAYEKLLEDYPDMPSFDAPKGKKIPAAWLIEKCGFKGKQYGNTGVHKDQALVLVNYGAATGAEVKALAEEIQNCVSAEFDIDLEYEVNFI